MDLVDADWDYCSAIDQFFVENAIHTGLAHHYCDDFVYFVTDTTEKFRSRKLSIIDEGTINYHFTIGDCDTADLGRRYYEGFVAPSDNTLFLVGFDETAHWDLIYFVLQPPGTRKLDGVALLGMQACTLRNRGASSGLAIARRTVLVRYSDWLMQGGDEYKLSKAAISWLQEDRVFQIQLAEHLQDDTP